MSGLEKAAKQNRDSSISQNKSSSGDDVVRLKRMMGSHPREINLFDRGGGRGVGGGGGGGGGGPNSCNSGGATEAVGHAYGDDVSSSSRLGGENFATSGTTNSQSFDIFAAAAYSATPYKSPEEMAAAAAAAAFPFTFAQWKELERQAMIYKYMISSVPVPPDLLFPHSRNFSAAPLDYPASLYNARYSRNGDPEPGRCKRTDGKKWRCSRDVAPHQKYCERHLHRGRPRSRKPVEVKNNAENLKKTRTEQSNVPSSTTVSAQQFAAGNDKPLLLFNAKNDPTVSDAPSSYKGPNRELSLMREGEMVVMDGTDQRWQHLIDSNMGFVNVGSSSVYGSSSLYHQDYVEQQPLDVLSYSNFSAPEIDAPTGFIDAWSINNLDSSNSGNAESSVTTNHGNLSPSLNLSIAMAAGNIVDQEMGSLECCDERHPRWINPLYWEPFARGGPLAEALQPGSVTISGCDSISAPATNVSSPTGVLHRTLFSHSDGSVCSSPAPAAPTSEIAFHRLN
ncbi:growth-regulating factor 2-like [Salvia miltiorrhiza]|uniref:growth-regulating factor 2-like n=1 Tax=Salvia miltiorrhiza TaxID=226208 RepID=UPI0025AD2473|nr:growth-regulating factor 2-like [Salvia miltiorrhiza]